MLHALLLAAAAQVGIADELTPAFPDTAFAEAHPRSVEGQVRAHSTESLRGMRTALHVYVSAEDGENVTLVVRHLESRDTLGLRLARLHAVPVEENTGLTSRTEQFEGVENPHVIRRAPFFVFDPIEPLISTSGAGADQATAPGKQGGVAWRLEIVPEQAGDQHYQVTIVRGEATESLVWHLLVHDAQLPPRSEWGFAYTNWFSPQEIARRHGVEAWSAEFWPLLRRYAELMADGGQDTFWLRWQDFFTQGAGGRWNLDHGRLE